MEKLYHVDFLKAHFKDFARSNLYTVEFNLPNLNSFSNDDKKVKVEMSAKTVNIPAFDIGKQEIKRMGQRFYLPASQVFGDIQMTLFCDSEYTQRYFLHDWIKTLIYNTELNNYQKISIARQATMKIIQLDNKFNPIFTTLYRYIWPTSISEIQLSYESDAQVVEFPVTFSFSTYKIL